ncbi:hypothetical protein KAH37_03445 [bacterium]|nr:hypothetical protein [bacterium]
MFAVIKKGLLFFIILSFFSIAAQDVQPKPTEESDAGMKPAVEKSEKQIYLRSFLYGDLSGDVFVPGASLSFVPWKSLEITVGAGGIRWWYNGSTMTLFSKIGWSFDFDLRSKDFGVIFRFPIAFGWRYNVVHEDGDWGESETRAHSLNISVGLELVLMFNRHFGISFNANISMNAIVAYRFHDMEYEKWSNVPAERVFVAFDGGFINFVARF